MRGGGSSIGEPSGPQKWGLEPRGPIGVYAYGNMHVHALSIDTQIDELG